MKKFRTIWMALMAVLMAAGFTSCSKEDTPAKEDEEIVDNPTTGDTKKLVRIVYENEFKLQTGTDITFTYDDQGLLKESIEIYYYGDETLRFESKYTWSESSILINTDIIDEIEGNSSNITTLTLSNGLVQAVASDDALMDGAEYSYDSSRRLVKGKSYLGDDTYTWEDAQLKSLSCVDGDYLDEYSFEYGENSTASGFCPIIPHRLTNITLYSAHPEIVGLKTNECPNKETFTYTSPSFTLSYTYTYEYEYDDDGFITKITETYTESGEVHTGVFTLVWE